MSHSRTLLKIISLLFCVTRPRFTECMLSVPTSFIRNVITYNFSQFSQRSQCYCLAAGEIRVPFDEQSRKLSEPFNTRHAIFYLFLCPFYLLRFRSCMVDALLMISIDASYVFTWTSIWEIFCLTHFNPFIFIVTRVWTTEYPSLNRDKTLLVSFSMRECFSQ